jgi:hypothetical protein
MIRAAWRGSISWAKIELGYSFLNLLYVSAHGCIPNSIKIYSNKIPQRFNPFPKQIKTP